MSLKDYQLLQNHEQYVQTLKECGFNEEEIQFKLEREGYITKVSRLYYKGEQVILQRWALFAQGYLGCLYPTEVTACKSNLQFSHKAEEEVENKGKQTHSRDKKLLKACLNH